MDGKNKVSLIEKIVVRFKDLHYEGVSDERVLEDFKYLSKNGQDSFLKQLVKNPAFEYSGELYKSENWKYFIFLYGKINLNKLPRDHVRPEFR